MEKISICYSRKIWDPIEPAEDAEHKNIMLSIRRGEY